MVHSLSLKEGGLSEGHSQVQVCPMPEPFHFASEHGSEGGWASPARVPIQAGQFPGPRALDLVRSFSVSKSDFLHIF